MPGPQYGVPRRRSTLAWVAQFAQMEPRRRKKIIALLLLPALISFSIMMTPVMWLVDRIQGTPEEEVRQYLTYLAAGDAVGALEMVDPGIPNERRRFLTNDVMASAVARLEIESVRTPSRDNYDSRSKKVEATLRVNGDRFTHTFFVDRKTKEQGDRSVWKIRDGLVVTVPVSGTRVSEFSVGGVAASLGDDPSAPTEYVFFPGVYALTPEGLGSYVSAQPAQIVVEDGSHASSYETTSVTLDGQLNSDLRGEVLEAMREAVRQCATLGTNTMAVCPAELRASTVTELAVATLPATLSSGTDEGTYVAADAVVTVRDTARDADGPPRLLTIQAKAAVALTVGGVPQVTIDDKPIVSVTLSVP